MSRTGGATTRTPDPVLVDLAHRAAEHLPELCRDVTAEICRQMDVYDEALTVSRPDLEASVEGNLRTMIDALTTPGSIDLTEAQATGTRRAHQGAPLPEVLRAFRIGFSALWDLLLEVATGSGEAEMRALVATATTFWVLIDEYLEAVTAAYRAASTELDRAEQDRRSRLLAALFAGALTNELSEWEVARALGLPSDGVFVAVAADTVTGELPLGEAAQRTLVDCGIVCLWQRTSSYELAIACVPGAGGVATLADALRPFARTRVGVSPSFVGLENAPRALRLAHVARASVGTGRTRVASFVDDPMAMLVAAAPDEATDIAHRVLRPVLELPEAECANLLDTARSWIRHAGSIKDAATELHCHPNTIRYRLQRLQSELRLSFSDPTSVALLVVVLQSSVSPRSTKVLPGPG